MSTFPPDGPGTPERDEAFDRLKAADLAAGTTPDLVSLRAAVDARLAADAAAPADELAARRTRRTWLPVAAAAAGALVLGTGGGVAIGAGLGSGSASDGGMQVAVGEGMDSSAGGTEAVAPGALGRGSNPAVGGADAAGTESDSRLAWWGYGHTDFTGQGLSTQGGSAKAYGLDAQSVYNADTIGRIAAALGVTGDPVEQDGSWSVGSTDGTGPSVWMYVDGTGSISYYNPAADPWACTDAGKAAADGASAGTDVMPAPCETRDFGAAPQGADLEAAMRAALGSIGVDLDAIEIEIDTTNTDTSYSYATAYLLVDGVRSGLSWGGNWSGAGLQSLYGSLASFVSLGDYDLISPAEAVDRLNDPRFGSGGGPLYYPAMAREGDAVSSDMVVEPVTPTVPPVAEPGSPIAWPVTHVTIVSAELVLSMQSGPDGVIVLAPSYEMTADDGSVWTVIAVADSALDFG